jgi:hypothetical protein
MLYFLICILNLTFYEYIVIVIPWKSNTPESKIYTSPSQIVMKFETHIGSTAKHLCQFFKYGMLKNKPHWGKKGTSAGFFVNSIFENVLRETF